MYTLQIISGYQFPKPNDSKKGEIIDPFIKIEIHGVKDDTQQCKTSVKTNNGNLPCRSLDEKYLHKAYLWMKFVKIIPFGR